jgi:hypothetical protein
MAIAFPASVKVATIGGIAIETSRVSLAIPNQ